MKFVNLSVTKNPKNLFYIYLGKVLLLQVGENAKFCLDLLVKKFPSLGDILVRNFKPKITIPKLKMIIFTDKLALEEEMRLKDLSQKRRIEGYLMKEWTLLKMQKMCFMVQMMGI